MANRKIILTPQAGKFVIRKNMKRFKQLLGADFEYIVFPGSGIYVMEVPQNFNINVQYGSMSDLLEHGHFIPSWKGSIGGPL